MTIPVTLDKVGMGVVLYRLANRNGRAKQLYGRLMSSWGLRPDRQRVTIKLTAEDLELLESLKLPQGTIGRSVVSSGWLVVYQHPNNSNLEVTVHSKTKPPKRRTFRMGGKKRRLVAVKATRIGKPTKEAIPKMARATKKKAVEEDELDELEGLEELDELEDEDLEDEEPEDEDEDEEDEEPAPKRSRAKKAPAKKAPAKKSRRKAEPVEEEDEDDEDEEPAPRSKKAAPAKSKKAAPSKKSSNGGGGLAATRELPKGKVGPNEIAEMVGGACDARYVRIWLRENEEKEEGARWAFGKQDARRIAKEIKAHRRKNADD